MAIIGKMGAIRSSFCFIEIHSPQRTPRAQSFSCFSSRPLRFKSTPAAAFQDAGGGEEGNGRYRHKVHHILGHNQAAEKVVLMVGQGKFVEDGDGRTAQGK